MGAKPNNQFGVNHVSIVTRDNNVCVCTWLVSANAILRYTLERLNISTLPGWVEGGEESVDRALLSGGFLRPRFCGFIFGREE